MKKGIILAGGTGTRLFPATKSISKQLIPVYDKPMIYYSLCTLMLAGITNVLIITRPDEQRLFVNLLGDGSQWGLHFSYATQSQPKGIAEAFMIGETFIGRDPVTLVLGDNIFYGEGLGQFLQTATNLTDGALIFVYYVGDPSRYGVAEFDLNGKVISLEEKPQRPKSPYAVTGLYCYGPEVCDVARGILPSARGELEITAINQWYLAHDQLRVNVLGRGIAWLDTGTHDALLEASNFVATIERRQGLKISAPEEIAYRRHLIDEEQLLRLAKSMPDADYGSYLERIVGPRTHYISE
jgi:glucose-1-phosphate thymidylyltransferase